MTAAVSPDLDEAQWMDVVVEWARDYQGWKVAHFRPARTQHGWRTAGQYDAKGWPDLMLIHPVCQRVLFRELKTDAGRLDKDQQKWRNWLVSAGADWAIWQPRDWPEVVRQLTTDNRWSVR